MFGHVFGSEMILLQTFCELPQDVTKKAAAAMVKVFSEVLRKRKIQVLSQAESITLIFDERSPHMILRYRCDQAALETVQACFD